MTTLPSGGAQLFDTLAFLLGAWRLERMIVDHLAGGSGSFVGTASLAAGSGSGSPVRARYEEVGELRIGAHRGSARRSLEYIRLDDGSVLLCFDDGRPFIELDLSTGTCRRVHDCGEDRYEIDVTVVSDVAVEERWRVRGPRKDYEAVTMLTRGRHGAAIDGARAGGYESGGRVAGDVDPGLGA